MDIFIDQWWFIMMSFVLSHIAYNSLFKTHTYIITFFFKKKRNFKHWKALCLPNAKNECIVINISPLKCIKSNPEHLTQDAYKLNEVVIVWINIRINFKEWVISERDWMTYICQTLKYFGNYSQNHSYIMTETSEDVYVSIPFNKHFNTSIVSVGNYVCLMRY